MTRGRGREGKGGDGEGVLYDGDKYKHHTSWVAVLH